MYDIHIISIILFLYLLYKYFLLIIKSIEYIRASFQLKILKIFFVIWLLIKKLLILSEIFYTFSNLIIIKINLNITLKNILTIINN